MDRPRLPDYLKRKIAAADAPINKKVREILKKYNLNTVCDGARCPNKCECYSNATATFLILGDTCTRNCRFCNISHCDTPVINNEEPKNVALAIRELNLKYAVITSVTRDDLDDYGAGHFAKTIYQIRKLCPETKIEILTPDFCGSIEAIEMIIKYPPDVFNHNIETVERLYSEARPEANYSSSLDVLKYIKEKSCGIITKTGLMVGLGETLQELEKTFFDIREAGVDILTIGQYISPSKAHLAVKKYYTPEEFEMLENAAKSAGIKYPLCAPLTRSSYKAAQTYEQIIEDK